MTEWFRRKTKNIKTFYKRDTTEGSWVKCPNCDEVLYKKVLENNFSVCNDCNYHFRLNFSKYIELIADNNQIITLNIEEVGQYKVSSAEYILNQL